MLQLLRQRRVKAGLTPQLFASLLADVHLDGFESRQDASASVSVDALPCPHPHVNLHLLKPEAVWHLFQNFSPFF